MIRPLRVPLALSVLLAPAAADDVHLSDGTVLEGVSVSTEGLTNVSYEEDGDKKTVASEKVLRVEFTSAPELVGEAQGRLLELDLATALDVLDEYVDGQIERSTERRHRWAPAHAAWKTVQLRGALGDYAGVLDAADRLIANYADTRYVPAAYLAKADAQLLLGNAADAQQTLGKLGALVTSENLGQRWALSVKVAQVRCDESKSGGDKRAELQAIASQAGSGQPVAAAFAKLVEGETYLADAEQASGASANQMRESARGIFQGLVDSFVGDDTTLAGAFSGLGDVFFYLGADNDDAATLQKAAVSYLRVATQFAQEGRYAPRSLFFAMRCFDLMQDSRRKGHMQRELASLYPNSYWAAESEKF